MADIFIRQKIPSDKVAVLIPWFLAAKPIPQISDPENPGEFIDKHNLKEWIEIVQIEQLKSICKYGRTKLALANQPPFDNNIVTGA